MQPVNASATRLSGKGLTLVRGGRLLFEGLDLSLAPGGAMLVTGANGAGKSSLLRLIAGLLEPSDGTLDNPFRTALLGSEPALKPDRTVASELSFWAGLDGADAASQSAAAEEMGIAPLCDLPCAMLSAGQRQRVALARILASGADLWLLDEPTTALDRASEARLIGAVAAHRDKGGLVVAATHHPLPLAGAVELGL